MQAIRDIQKLNQSELDNRVTERASWHYKYRNSAYIRVHNLDHRITEGDLIVVFSQFGEIVDLNICRHKITGNPLGFAFIAYEDQRSTVLAIDNMIGVDLLGRTIMVDHAMRYQMPKSRKPGHGINGVDEERYDSDSDYEERRRLIWDYEAYASDSDDLSIDLDSDLNDSDDDHNDDHTRKHEKQKKHDQSRESKQRNDQHSDKHSDKHHHHRGFNKNKRLSSHRDDDRHDQHRDNRRDQPPPIPDTARGRYHHAHDRYSSYDDRYTDRDRHSSRDRTRVRDYRERSSHRSAEPDRRKERDRRDRR